MQIGRSNRTAGETGPEIALDDPHVSREHAVLERQNDGSYVLRDLGSMNGTFINEQSRPIGNDARVRLADDDEIHIGAWTTMKLRVM